MFYTLCVNLFYIFTTPGENENNRLRVSAANETYAHAQKRRGADRVPGPGSCADSSDLKVGAHL